VPHGVVSLLDRPSSARVKRLWTRLEDEFDLHGVLVMPYPHFSYHVASDYRRQEVETKLADFARSAVPFTIRTAGLSQFEGSFPVVYVAVEADSRLHSLHEQIWAMCDSCAVGSSEYYRPDTWVPHITLAHGEERNTIPLSENATHEVMQALKTEDLRWTVPIDNIALVWDDGVVQKPVTTFYLTGR
jgi:2'-5' RNA ligase